MTVKRLFVFTLALALAILAVAATIGTGTPASAAAAVEVITECSVTRQLENTPPTDNWVLYTRTGTPPTAGAFVTGPSTPPLGAGSLQFTTSTGGEKVFLFNYDHVGKELSDISTISYNTYRTSGSAQQVTALNIQVDFNGPDVTGGFTTLVFEPVYNTAQGPVVSGQWQDWIATGAGVWWSTSAINGQCAGAATACQRTWSQIVANNPDATIVGGFGLNQGSGNAGLVAASDALTLGFNGNTITYDFEPDADQDCVADSADNCPNTQNPDQLNTDGDAQGDACDTDDDNDGVLDETDNCPLTQNGDQANNDEDAQGDACDTDDDNDGVADSADNCPFVPNQNQENNDADAFGDACDTDDDNDGITDETDNCPFTANTDQANNDGDAQGDACDADDDNDGVLDGADNCQFAANADQANNDGDAQGDVCDADDDNDGVADGPDNCDFVSNPGQENADGDALGDVCDPDDDNDTVPDVSDDCPGTAPGTVVGSTGCPLAVTKDQCKNDGWKTVFRADGSSFKNQGQCVQYTNNGK